MPRSIRQLRPASTSASAAADVLDSFPYHLIVDEQLTIVECGSALYQLDPELLPHRNIADCFDIAAPIEVFCLTTLMAVNDELCLLRHKSSGLMMGGKLAAHKKNRAVFLLFPWVTDTAGLAKLELETAKSKPELKAAKHSVSTMPNTKGKFSVQKKQLFQAHALLSMRESESRTLTHIVSMSDNSVVIANAMGYVEWVNDAYMQRSGNKAEEVIGRYLGDLLDADEATVDKIRKLLESGQGYQAELLRTAKNGSEYWVDLDIEPLLDSNGSICNYIAIARDITEKKAALEVSGRLHGIMKSTFELSPDGFVTFNQTGVLTSVNPAFIKMTGLAQAQLIDIKQEAFERLLSGLSNDDETFSGHHMQDAVIMRLSQPRLTVIKRSIREAHDDDRFVGTIHYFRDITQESELHRMKGEFLSMAAHELRTPMSSIHGFTELLLKREFKPEQQKDMLATVHRQSTRLTKLINDLLDLAKIEARKGMSFDIKPYRLTDIVDTALKEFMVSGEGRAIGFAFNNHSLKVSADFDKIIQALMNVLSNAHKYSAPGTEIDLSILEQEKYQHSFVGLSIVDHGIGMTNEHLSRLFERFYRADTSGNIPGTGLGLCLVKEIVEIHGGWVDVSSVLGEGTTVTLWLKKLKD